MVTQAELELVAREMRVRGLTFFMGGTACILSGCSWEFGRRLPSTAKGHGKVGQGFFNRS